MAKLTLLKQRMEETIVQYDGDNMTLWDFSQLQIQTNLNDFEGSLASFSDQEKRKKLSKLMECISDIEGELLRVISPAPSTRESITKFFNLKLFGSFEQMRVEMELRYKAHSTYLTT